MINNFRTHILTGRPFNLLFLFRSSFISGDTEVESELDAYHPPLFCVIYKGREGVLVPCAERKSVAARKELRPILNASTIGDA